MLNDGYRVSFTHTHKTSIKTDAPAKVIWDIMRCWESNHPLKEKRKAEKSPGNNILSKQADKQYCFDLHRDANPQSRREGFVRFQENPLPFWGPGVRSTAMLVYMINFLFLSYSNVIRLHFCFLNLDVTNKNYKW